MKVLIALAFLVVCPVVASAQNNSVEGYGFFGVAIPDRHGSLGSGETLGLGGQIPVYKGIGVQPEIAYESGQWGFNRYDSIGSGSIDGIYSFRPGRQHSKWELFISGGDSIYFAQGAENGWNVGGGVNLWLRKHMGLRLEFREFRGIAQGISTDSMASIRIGVAFK